MNIEFFRRETTKKIVGLTMLPRSGASVTIAKGLEPIDFIGMIIQDDDYIFVVNNVGIGRDADTNELISIVFAAPNDISYNYDPKTGVLSSDE